MTNDYLKVADSLKIGGYEFEMGKYISEGWKKGTAVVGWFVLFIIISLFFSFACGLIPIIGGLANSWVISPALSAGLILFMKKKYETDDSDFGLIFKGFSTNFGNVILVNLLIGLISLVALVPFFISFLSVFDFEALLHIAQNSGNASGMTEIAQMVLGSIGALGIGFSISMILFLVISVFFSLSNYFVVVGGLSATSSIGASFGVVKKCFFPILGFFIVLGLINLAGVLALGIGIIVSMPVSIMAMYAMFHNIVASKVSDDQPLLNSDDVLDA